MSTVTGRRYAFTRPRGLAPWRPQRATREQVAAIQAVLAEYRDFLPLTARQIFYRLVGAYGLPKTENAYDTLLDRLNRARRAGMIPWEAIRDDGAVSRVPSHFDGVPAFWSTVRLAAEDFTLDRQEGQQRRLEVWCEAAGMVPQLENVAAPFGVGVYSAGGFDSLTVKYLAAVRIVNRVAPTVILHVGDLDPDGCAIVDSVADDLAAFVADLGQPGHLEVVRLVVTPQQVVELALPEAPVKLRKDGQAIRGGAMGATVQAEAIDPGTLAELVRAEISARIDEAAYDRVLEREWAAQCELLRVIDGGVQ